MDEILEAEIFCKELDKILAGEPAATADLDPEIARDLAFAARLARLDFANESRAKRAAKEKILTQAKEGKLRGLLRRAGVRPVVAVGAAVAVLASAVLFFAPLGERFEMREAGMAGDVSTFTSSPYMGSGAVAGGAIGGAMSSLTAGNYDGNSAAPGRGYAANKANAFGLLGHKLSSGSARKALAKRAGNAAEFSRNGNASLRGSGSGGMQTTFVLPGIPKSGASPEPGQQPEPSDREGYDYVAENDFLSVRDNPLSTFSIDVDAASYANVRRMLNESRLPPADAVRIEEMVNYFHYDYPEPEGEHPFSITAEQAACPWNAKHKLVRVGIKGKSIPTRELPANNLVFLIDTSGSMMSMDKLPLLKKGLSLLVQQLRPQDRVSIVAYAGSAGLVLPSTRGDKKADILEAINRLEAGGSTAGGAGIQLAYEVAAKNFLKSGNNRVILATDGDFNVGLSSDGELTRMIEEKREKGVFLTVLGFGTGNYQDAKMEKLADKGNGNYAYVDNIMEAEKVLVKEMGATLLTIAKDVKIQVEFNPAKVGAYRLIGYEDRLLAAQDFNDDKKDAGELGAGKTVTALYEIVPKGEEKDVALPSVDPLKYQKPAESAAAPSAELLTVKFRYKRPTEDKSRLIERPLPDETIAWTAASKDLKFAAAVAGFGMTLRGSKHKGPLTYAAVAEMAREGVGADEGGYRAELVRLVEKADVIERSGKR